VFASVSSACEKSRQSRLILCGGKPDATRSNRGNKERLVCRQVTASATRYLIDSSAGGAPNGILFLLQLRLKLPALVGQLLLECPGFFRIPGGPGHFVFQRDFTPGDFRGVF
jgi:hypothetical protein